MDFDNHLSKVQGVLLSLGSRRMLNSTDSTDAVIDLLKDIIQNLSKNEKFKITFFMVLNTDLSVCEELENDENMSLITHITPVIEKNYLLDYLYKLNLQSHLNTIIENYPVALTLELIHVYLGKLKEASFHRDEYGISHIYDLWCSLFVKAWRMERGDDDNGGSKEVVSAFEELYGLIQKIVVASMKIGGEKLEPFIGGHLYHLFDTIWSCLSLVKNEKEVEALEKLELTVTLKNKFDDAVEKPCEKCLNLIFRDIRNILEELTVDIWMSLSECYFERESKTSMQESIGGRIHDICRSLEGVEVPRDVFECLSALKIKPKTESDEMAAAGLEEIIANVEGGKESWFKALVRHPGFIESDSLKTVLDNLALADEVDVDVILNATLTHIIDFPSQSQMLQKKMKNTRDSTRGFKQEKKRATEDAISAGDTNHTADSSEPPEGETSEVDEFGRRKENLELSKKVFLRAVKMTRKHSLWLDRVFQNYRPCLLVTENSDLELGVTINRLTRGEEESAAISDLVCLCMQLPRPTLERLCSFALDSGDIDRWVGVLKTLEPACVMNFTGELGLLEDVLVSLATSRLREKEKQCLASLVVGLGKEDLVSVRFFKYLLRCIKNRLELGEREQTVECLEILKSSLEADLVKGELDRLPLVVFLSGILDHLSWDPATLASVDADVRDLVDDIVGFLMKNLDNEDESRLEWARLEIGRCSEINQAHFCDLWFRFGKRWAGSGMFHSSLLVFAHSTLDHPSIEFAPHPLSRTPVLLSLTNVLPFLTFHKWLSIFNRILDVYPEDEALEIFADAHYLFAFNLNRDGHVYPCFERCVRNLGRLVQTRLPKMTPVSSENTLKKMLFVLNVILNKDYQRECSLAVLPVLLGLIGKVKEDGASVDCGHEIRKTLGVFPVVEVVEAIKRNLSTEEGRGNRVEMERKH